MVYRSRRAYIDKKRWLYCPKCCEAVERTGRQGQECLKCFTTLEKIKGRPRVHGHAGRVVNGHHYDSGFEADYAQELDLRKKAGDIKDWWPHQKIDLVAYGCHIAFYEIDFKIEHNDGTVEYVEVKGHETDLWRIKWRLFEAQYSDQPGVKLTVIK